MDEAEIIDRIRCNPPLCVKEFRLSPAKVLKHGTQTRVAYRLLCKCGSGTGELLGYPFRNYEREYNGNDFISPLWLKCRACEKITLILDTDIHGYHAEVAKLEGGTGSSKLRGKGTPDPFACPKCSKQFFDVTVTFAYWHFDIAYDEPELPIQDFFNEFLIHAQCKACKHTALVADFGKL